MFKKQIKPEEQKFNDSFEEETEELIVLTNNMGPGASRIGKEKFWNVSQAIIAYIDEEGNLHEAEGRLEWQAASAEKGYKMHSLKKKGICKVVVRRRKPGKYEDYQELIEKGIFQEPPHFRHYFMLVKVVKRKLKNPELLEILAEYERPVILEDDQLGKLVLNKELHFFEGRLNWNGNDISIYLDLAEKNEQTAEKAEAVLKQFYQEAAEYDQKFRAFAAAELTELANDWLSEESEEEPKPITEKQFAERIKLSEISVHQDGSFEIYYDDDDLFWGHVIIVSGDKQGQLTDADIAG